MNARVGKVPISNVVGVFGEVTVNFNGEVLREIATFNELKVTNTFSVRKIFTNIAVDVYKRQLMVWWKFKIKLSDENL